MRAEVEKEEAIQEISNRIQVFVQDFRMLELFLDRQSDTRIVISENSGVQDNEKHSTFYIDVSFDSSISSQSTKVTVYLESYSSSVEGLEKVRKVQNQVSSFRFSACRKYFLMSIRSLTDELSNSLLEKSAGLTVVGGDS